MFGSKQEVHQFGDGLEAISQSSAVSDVYSEETNEDGDPVSQEEAAIETRDAMTTVGISHGDNSASVNLLDGAASATVGGTEFGADFREKKFNGEMWGFKADLDLVKGEGKLELPGQDILPETEYKQGFEFPLPIPGMLVSFSAGVKAQLSMKASVLVTRTEAPAADGLQK